MLSRDVTLLASTLDTSILSIEVQPLNISAMFFTLLVSILLNVTVFKFVRLANILEESSLNRISCSDLEALI